MILGVMTDVEMSAEVENMNLQVLQSKIIETVRAAKEIKPLVPSLTNVVTAEFVADAQLAVGGSAAVQYLPDEVEAMADMCGAYYFNFGTLAPFYEETVQRALKRLNKLNKPWVLDPVAVGIGGLRTCLLLLFREYPPVIIRGNATEIISLAKLWELTVNAGSCKIHGVDTVDSTESAEEAAVLLARFIGGAVAVSGETDLVTDGKSVLRASGGSPLFTQITGAGCSLGGVAAVYAAVAEPLVAAVTAVQAYNYAGARAAELASAPFSFKTMFLDELYLMKAEAAAEQKLEIYPCIF